MMLVPKLIAAEVAVILATVSTVVARQTDDLPAGLPSIVDTLLGSATVGMLLIVMLQLSGIRERMKHTPTKEEMAKADTHWRHEVHNNLTETVGKMEIGLSDDISRVENDVRDLRRRLDDSHDGN